LRQFLKPFKQTSKRTQKRDIKGWGGKQDLKTPTFMRCWSCEHCFARALISSGSILDWGRITKSKGVASGLDVSCLADDCPDLGLHSN
jgi:hypothetical protein